MSALPPGGRTDVPMMPMAVYPPANQSFMQPPMIPNSGTAHINKVSMPPVRSMHVAGHVPAATATHHDAQVPHVNVMTNAGVVEGVGVGVAHGVGAGVGVAHSKTGSNHNTGESVSGTVDSSQLKEWSTEQTVELIQLYKKYLPEFHKYGQRKMNVWQHVTEEMVSKGYVGFSWAECSAKFRSLRDKFVNLHTSQKCFTSMHTQIL